MPEKRMHTISPLQDLNIPSNSIYLTTEDFSLLQVFQKFPLYKTTPQHRVSSVRIRLKHNNQPWIREEQIDSQVQDFLKAIEIDDKTVNDIIRALKNSYQDEKRFRRNEVDRLQKRYDDLQKRLDKSYEDRLDGVIDDRYWRDISTKWREEQDQITCMLNQLTNANRDHIEQAIEILELSQTAYSLYLEQNSVERRKLLGLLLSNCTIDGLTLCPTYKKPFNLIAEGRELQSKLPEPCKTQNFCDDFGVEMTELSSQ